MEKSHHVDGIINQDSVSGISHRLCYSFWWWIFHLTRTDQIQVLGPQSFSHLAQALQQYPGDQLTEFPVIP